MRRYEHAPPFAVGDDGPAGTYVARHADSPD